MEAVISTVAHGIKMKKKSAIRKQGKEKYDTGNSGLSDLLEGSAVFSGILEHSFG
jgi:hypothetical protein